MHRALTIVEIVEHICDIAEDDLILAALASTCNLFHEPAIQTLWHVLYDIVPLIKCFPADCWEIVGSKIVGPFMTLPVLPTR